MLTVSVPPIVHCVRHAQAYHNLKMKNHKMPDPSLTPLGEEQSGKLQKTFPHHDSVELLVSSPIRRALYTTLIGFESDVQRGLKVIALPDVQETSDHPCDTGSNPDKLEEEFGKGGRVDLSLVHEGWNVKEGRYAPTPKAIEARARTARQWLKKRPEKEIVLVSHGGFLHYLTQDWTFPNIFWGTGWANTEFRSYRFVEDQETQSSGDDDNASLAETDESKRLRSGKEKPLTDTEKVELLESTQKAWEEKAKAKTDVSQGS